MICQIEHQVSDNSDFHSKIPDMKLVSKVTIFTEVKLLALLKAQHKNVTVLKYKLRTLLDYNIILWTKRTEHPPNKHFIHQNLL